MALKRNSSYAALDDITHFMNSAAERGGVVCLTLAASFTSQPDDPDNTVEYATAPSGSAVVPVGVLMQDVLNYDPTQVERNFQNPFETVVGSKVWVRREGYVETNMIESSVLGSLVPGDAYLAPNGELTTNPVTGIKVGKFESYPDSDGYVKFYINVNQ